MARRKEATTVIIALPSAEGSVIREIAASAGDGGLEVLVLPPITELLGRGHGPPR